MWRESIHEKKRRNVKSKHFNCLIADQRCKSTNCTLAEYLVLSWLRKQSIFCFWLVGNFDSWGRKPWVRKVEHHFVIKLFYYSVRILFCLHSPFRAICRNAHPGEFTTSSNKQKKFDHKQWANNKQQTMSLWIFSALIPCIRLKVICRYKTHQVHGCLSQYHY